MHSPWRSCWQRSPVPGPRGRQPAQPEPSSTIGNDVVDTPRLGCSRGGAIDSDSATQPVLDKSLLDRFLAAFSQEDDPAGPINTDRPLTSCSLLPIRLSLAAVFSSNPGFTFDLQQTSKATTTSFDLPEAGHPYRHRQSRGVPHLLVRPDPRPNPATIRWARHAVERAWRHGGRVQVAALDR